MNMRTNQFDPAVTDHFLCATGRRDHVEWLAQALVSVGVVESAPTDTVTYQQRIAVFNPVALFVDFSGEQTDAARALVEALRRSHPDLPVVALGSVSEPESMLAAMRSGVSEFVDYTKPAEDALRIAKSLLDRVDGAVVRHGKVVSVLGARVGMGASTFAANLAVLMQKRMAVQHQHVALLDLGLPAGDGALFLNMRCEFDFVEAVRNLRRIDRTFVNTALSHHASGMVLSTLPANLAELRDVSYSASVGLLNRLRSFFDYQIVDLGGFSNHEFVAHIVGASDEVWLMCDQGVASVVSAVELLDSMREAKSAVERMRLIVNQYDPELGLAPDQIAERLGIPHFLNLPSRRVAIGLAANQGKLIVEENPRDPYVKSIEVAADKLAPVAATSTASEKPSGLAGLKGLFSNSFSKRS